MPRLGRSPLGAQLSQLFAVANESNRLDAERGTADSTASIQEVLTRRDVLRGAAILGAAGVAGSALAFLDSPRKLDAKVRIAIVGGGIAGLSAAYHLKRAGLRAELYEAQPRIGGRINTRHTVLGGRLTTEVGASFIDSDHTDMLRLAKTFGIGMWDTMAKSEAKLQPAYYFGGKMRWNEEVLAAMKPFVARIARDQNKAVANSYKSFNKLAGELDHQSADEYLKEIGVSGWLYDFLDVALMTEMGTELHKLSALQAFGELGTNTSGPYDLFGSSDQRYATKGGNHQIPAALAEQVENQIHMNYWMESVRKTASGDYELTFSTPGGVKTVTADYVIMTIPFKVLRDLEVEADLPALKKKAIAELNYGDNCKLILGFDTRFWRSQGTTGLFFTDLPIQSGWDSGWMQPTTESSLTLFFGGQVAINEAAKPAASRVLEYLPQIDQMYPGALKHYNNLYTQFNWPHYKYIRGSYSAYGIGQQTTFGGIEPVPVGNLYFAGEHCDPDNQGFMNAGAKTGRLAAAALVSAIR